MLPEAELRKLWNASLELYPVEFTHEEATTHTVKIPLCRDAKKGCKFGDKCRWRHDDSAKEWARAKKVRDERPTAVPKAPSAASVWAEDYDAENPWLLSTRFYDAADS